MIKLLILRYFDKSTEELYVKRSKAEKNWNKIIKNS